MTFDANMTYWQSLKIVTRGLIQWPMCRSEIEEFIDALTDTLYYLSLPLIRVLALLTLPISALLLTFAVQAERQQKAKDAKNKARQTF